MKNNTTDATDAAPRRRRHLRRAAEHIIRAYETYSSPPLNKDEREDVVANLAGLLAHELAETVDGMLWLHSDELQNRHRIYERFRREVGRRAS